MQKHPAIIGIFGGIVGTVLVGIAVWLLIAYTGAYNVAASQQHFDPVRWTLDTTRNRSIANRAGGADISETAPESVLSDGARHYAQSCAYCHGAPGEEPAEWSRGMRPEPPHLSEAASEWSKQEIHWIVTNGIKMTGMPAFGAHHSANEIAAITSFVSALPGLTPDDYTRLAGRASGQAEQGSSTPAGSSRDTQPEDE